MMNMENIGMLRQVTIIVSMLAYTAEIERPSEGS